MLTIRALFLGSLALAFVCVTKAPEAVEKVEAVDEKSTPRAPVTEDDFKIFDVVLLDLLDYEDAHAFHHRKDATTEIILDTMTKGDVDSGYISQAQLDAEARSDKGRGVSAEFGDDLRRRNPKEAISLAGYKSPSPKILVRKLGGLFSAGKIPDEVVKANHFVYAWLPGYSKDGNTAVFRASFDPTPHGAIVTYKLAKKDGKWMVAWRCVGFRR